MEFLRSGPHSNLCQILGTTDIIDFIMDSQSCQKIHLPGPTMGDDADESYFGPEQAVPDCRENLFADPPGFENMLPNLLMDSESQPENQESINQQVEDDDMPDYKAKYVFQKKKLIRQNKNTPRFLARLAVKYLPTCQHSFPPNLRRAIVAECSALEKWHLKEKGHVYLMSHLSGFFSAQSKFGEEQARIGRRVFDGILKDHALNSMLEPKSQIKSHKKDYLRCAKIYSLRCRHRDLIGRNQCQ